MNKELTIKVNSKLDMFKAYLAAINWTFGTESLTESEIEVLALLMYYNNVYKEITDNQVRSDLLLSNVVKKKMKEEFGISSSKLETYLGKLRKKGLITSMLNPKFMLYPDNLLSVKFNFVHNLPVITPVITQTPEVSQEIKEEIQENYVSVPTPESIPPVNISNNLESWTSDYEE